MHPDHDPAPEVTAPLSGSRMKQIARAVAGCPDLWQPWVRTDPDSRWHQRLQSEDDHDVWLETWLPGQETGWHDHAGSSGVLVVGGCAAASWRSGFRPSTASCPRPATSLKVPPAACAAAPCTTWPTCLWPRPSASTSTHPRSAPPAATRSAPGA